MFTPHAATQVIASLADAYEIIADDLPAGGAADSESEVPTTIAECVPLLAIAMELIDRGPSALIALSAIAYVPLALAFTPWAWSNSGLLSVQWCRPLLYGVYFFAGVGIGAAGIDVGLVAADGALGRRWKLWLAVAIASLLLWMGVTALTMNGPAPVVIEIAAALCFVLACAGGCFFVIASSLRFGTTPSSGLDSLSTNAYSLYLVHYVPTVWLQYALLGAPLIAFVKAVIVFCGTVIVSWLSILLYQRIPFALRLIFTRSHSAAAE